MPSASFLRTCVRLFSLVGACAMASPFVALRAQSPSVSDGFDPNANGLVGAMALQADGKVLIGGTFTTLQPNGAANATTRNRIARLNADGSLDASFDPNANNQIYAIAVQTDGKIVIGGAFTTLQPNGAAAATTRNHIARLNADGSLDAGFNPNANGTFVGQVYCVAVQSDGRIVIGGAFSTLQPNGAATATTRNHIARLNADGSLDTGFNPNASAAVDAIALQTNGQIVIGGAFSTLQPNGAANPTIRSHVARLNTDGTVDGGFDPSPNASIGALAVQADGKILFSGTFTMLSPNGAATPSSRSNLARVNSDGTLDTAFGPNPSSVVNAIVLQSDGKILLGGAFFQLFPIGATTGTAFEHVARLNVDGSIDGSFDPSSNGIVNAIAVQKDGRIVLGGNFTQLFANAAVATSQRNNIARVNPDGSLDVTFNPDDNGRILTLARQPDGSVLLGGTLTSVGGVTRTNLARISATGVLDASFNPTVNGTVTQVLAQSDGKVLISGNFNNINGVTRNGVARLNSDGTLDAGFNPNPNAAVLSMALQSDGRLLIAGSFSGIQANGATTSTAMNGIARLNTDGSLDTNFPNLEPNSRVNAVAVQTDGKIIIAGEFTGVAPNGATIFTSRNFIARFNSDGTLDANFDPNFDNSVSVIALQSDGRILVGGGFSRAAPNEGAVTIRSHVARLNSDGTVDTNFDPNPNNNVTLIAVQPDGHVFIGGVFTTVQPNEGVAVFSRYNFARLNVDGSVDQGFIPNPNTNVNAVLVQADGSFFAAGGFTSISNAAADHLVLFNANGTLNSGFSAQATGFATSAVGGIALQPDGGILAAGSFSGLGGARGVNVARFNPDSSPDATFNASTDGAVNAAAVLPGSAAVSTQDSGVAWITATGALRAGFGSDTIAQINGSVSCVAVQSDGKVIVGGNFKNNSGATGNNILRLNANGTLDTSFNPNPNNLISGMAIQSDGKIIVVGAFTGLDNAIRNFIARLNTDGSLDTAFDPNANNPITTMALQSDGRILIGGTFGALQPNGSATAVTRFGMARLNTDGTVDSNFNPNIAGGVVSILVQPNGQILIGGPFTTLQPNGTGDNITRNFVARLNSDGTVDNGFDPEPNGQVNAFVLQSDGKVVLGGAFTTIQPNLGTTIVTRNSIARVNSDGSVDMTYDPNTNGQVNALTPEPNGEIIAAGTFLTLQPNGAPAPTTRSRVALIKTDGTIDASLDPAPNGQVNAVALQSDGSIVLGGSFNNLQPTGAIYIGGSFANVSNIAVANLALLNADGSPNTSFQGNPNGTVYSIAVQADSRVIVAGSFSTISGTARGRVARISATGSLDTSFNPNANGTVQVAALQGNGQVVLAGSFTSVGGIARSNLARVNSDGSLDASFNPNVNGTINALAVQPNGQVVLAGSFTSVGGIARSNLARVNSDGSLDTSFNPTVNGTVNALVLQTSGQIILGGSFSSVGGTAQANLARISSSGAPDTSFTASADGAVAALALQPDGKLFLGGSFSHVNGLSRFRFARLGETGGSSQSISVSGNFTSATWTRTGTGPEIAQVEFQVSTDSTNWTNLAAGSRVGTTSNWQITGVSLPGSSVFFLRTLGMTPNSQFGSSSLIETVQEFDSATGATGSSVSLGGVSSGSSVGATSASSSAGSSKAGALASAASLSVPFAGVAPVGSGVRLITFASRADVAADSPLVAGFTIAGPASKAILLRAVGPGLGIFGVQGVVANPYLQLYDGSGRLVLANTGWNGDSSLAAAFAEVGAFPLAVGSSDAAALAVLPPGSYTLQVGGTGGQAGVALAEVYDADANPLLVSQQISSASADTDVPGGESLTGGFVVAGSSARTVLVRAVGPALGAAGMASPVLTVYDSQGNVLARNAGWGNPATVNAAYPASDSAGIASAAASAGAPALLSGNADSAVVLKLPSGAYTAQVTDANGGAGSVRVEVYTLSQ